MTNLREYLVLDDELVTQFVGQLVGGTTASVNHQTKKIKGADTGVNLAGLSAGAAHKGESEMTHEVSFTSENRVAQLENLLKRGESLRPITAMDEKAWATVKDGEIVELTGTLEVPDLVKTFAMAKEFGGLMDVFEGLVDDSDFHETKSQIESFQTNVTAASNYGHLLVVRGENGGSDAAFVAKPLILKRDFLDFDNRRITILGRIKERVDHRSSKTLSSLLPNAMRGIESMNREQRRAAKTQPTASTTDLDLKGPALILAPLAVYA